MFSESVTALGVRCAAHNTLALYATKNLLDVDLYWLPCLTGLNASDSVFSHFNDLLGEYLKVQPPAIGRKYLKNLSLLSTTKVTLLSDGFRFQYLYTAQILPEFCVCEQKNDSGWLWVPMSSCLKRNSPLYLGDEVDEVIDGLREQKSFRERYREITPMGSVYRFLHLTGYQAYFKSVIYNEKNIGKLYRDFHELCYPATTMCSKAFEFYTQAMKLRSDKSCIDFSKLFRTFCLSETCNYLSFSKLLLGFAFIEPKGGPCPARASYIFDYYSSSLNGIERSTLKTLENIMEPSSTMIPDKKSLDYLEFLTWWKKLDPKESSKLLRHSKPLMRTICSKMLFSSIENDHEPEEYSCSPTEYSLVPYCIDLNTKQLKHHDNTVKTIEQVLTSRAHRVAYQVLEQVRQYKVKSETVGDNCVDILLQISVQNILELCKEARLVFLSEPTLLQLTTPCMVFGDIHGNLTDLLHYEQLFWANSPMFHPLPVLFLGDYVDRGDHSIEVSIYLFALKILVPNRVFLLRGNHELRHIQKNYSFEKECHSKLGKDAGSRVWESINSVFDVLPISAVVGEKIFCSHGGIPSCAKQLNDISQENKVLFEDGNKNGDVEKQSPIAWELLWNDPFEDDKFFREYLNTCPWTSEVGMSPNIGRGTGMYYTAKHISGFIKENDLCLSLRGHECPVNGTELKLNDQVCTVFSCSNYCGGRNKAGMLLIDHPTRLGVVEGSDAKLGLVHRFQLITKRYRECCGYLLKN